MSLQSRIETLKGRHASLELRIADEDHRPRPNGDALQRLKVEKLRLKEELERLAQQRGIQTEEACTLVLLSIGQY